MVNYLLYPQSIRIAAREELDCTMQPRSLSRDGAWSAQNNALQKYRFMQLQDLYVSSHSAELCIADFGYSSYSCTSTHCCGIPSFRLLFYCSTYKVLYIVHAVVADASIHFDRFLQVADQICLAQLFPSWDERTVCGPSCLILKLISCKHVFSVLCMYSGFMCVLLASRGFAPVMLLLPRIPSLWQGWMRTRVRSNLDA